MVSLTNLAKTSLTFVAFNIPWELAHCSRCQSTSSPLSIITLVNPGTQDSMHYSIICWSAMITWLITRTMHKDMGVAQKNIHSGNKKVILNDWLVPKKCFSELWNGGHVQFNTLTNGCWSTSLETQERLVGAGKSLNGREKKLGWRKVDNTNKKLPAQSKVKVILVCFILKTLTTFGTKACRFPNKTSIVAHKLYYDTPDSLWKIWVVESIQSIHNYSLWTWHDKCNMCCRYCIYHAKFNVYLVTKPLGVFSSETKWPNVSLLFPGMNNVKSV